MAVQVAQASDPSAHSPANAATAAAYKDELLSPVSKLEAARKQAAIEQQKRVEVAVARMASVKSENAGKRKLLEEKLDAAHGKVKVQKTTATHSVTTVATSATSTVAAVTTTQTQTQTQVVASTTAAAASTLASASATKTTQQQQTARKLQTKTASANYDATAELLRATRNKLNNLVDDEQADDGSTAAATANATDKPSDATADGDNWDGPSTNYHLKQLGLAKKKIDIYAPVAAQQQEIRRLRDRSRFAPKLIVVDVAEDHDSEIDDSDFTPDAASDDGEADDADDDDELDSDAESIPEVEPEETLELAKESAEHAQMLRRQKLFRQAPLVLLFVCVVIVFALVGVDVAQQRLHICPVDASADSICGSFLQLREHVATAVGGAYERGYAVAANAFAAARASFHREL